MRQIDEKTENKEFSVRHYVDLFRKHISASSFPNNEFYVDKEGNEVRKTKWHTIVLWNKVAGIIEEYVKKGTRSMWRAKCFDLFYSWIIK